MIEIEMLQTSIARAVEQHKNRHHLCIGHGAIPVILALLCGFSGIDGIFLDDIVKILAEIITH